MQSNQPPRYRAGIVGYKGAMGQRLADHLLAANIKICFVKGSGPDEPSLESLIATHRPDAVFSVISDKDQGVSSLAIMEACVKTGTPVIASDKGFAYNAWKLMPHIDLIGYSAMVGGGTGILKYMHRRRLAHDLTDMPVRIDGVFNATTNFIQDLTYRRRLSSKAAHKEAKFRRIAEPNSDDIVSLFNAEIRDKVKKVCIFSALVLGIYIIPEGLGSIELTKKDVQFLTSRKGNYRLVASLYRNTRTIDTDGLYFGKRLTYRTGNGWQIVIGFRKVTPDLKDLIPQGAGNAVRCTEGDPDLGLTYILKGPGAGLDATINAMLCDMTELVRRNRRGQVMTQ